MLLGLRTFALSVAEPSPGCEYRLDYDPSIGWDVPVEEVCGFERLLLPHNLVLVLIVVSLSAAGMYLLRKRLTRHRPKQKK